MSAGAPPLQQHAYLRPQGGGPCVECGEGPANHEPFPRFISIAQSEAEGAALNLPPWKTPLWDGIHAWVANFSPAALKTHREALGARGGVPSKADAVTLVEFVVERALAAERSRIREQLLASTQSSLEHGHMLALLDRICPEEDAPARVKADPRDVVLRLLNEPRPRCNATYWRDQALREVLAALADEEEAHHGQ
jgi:hypothetical protein